MAARAPRLQLRIIHVALLLSAITITAIIWMIRRMPNAAPPPSEATHLILYVGLAVGALALALAVLVWRNIPAFAPPTDPAAWARAAVPRMVVAWAMLEGAAVVGGVTYFVTGNAVACGGLSGLAIVALVFHSPGKVGPG
jgi:hypothetical protein